MAEIKSPTGESYNVSGRGDSVRAQWLPARSDAGSKPVLAHRSMVKTGADVHFNIPEVRNPLLNVVNFYLPQDYKILNQWIRYYDRFHPLVGNSIDLHAEFPMSSFELVGVEDKSIQLFYDDFQTKVNLFQRLLEISREFELIGEVFPFFHWNRDLRMFDSIVILNPDYVSVNTLPYASGAKTQFALIPDEELKRMVRSTDPRDQRLVRSIDPQLIEAANQGGTYMIDDLYIDMLARKASPYDTRGTSIVLRCLKDLMYEDKLRETQYVIADSMLTPRALWKIGDPANDWMPNNEDLGSFRALLEQAAHDPNFAIIWHHAVNVEYVGPYGKILPIIPEFQFVEDRILTALYTNKAMTTGVGPTYSSSQVGMQVLQARYMTKRVRLEEMCLRKLWIPMALANSHFSYTEAELSHGIRVKGKDRRLIIPKIKWNNRLNLQDDSQEKNFYLRMRDKLQISQEKIHELFNIDHATEQKRIKGEESTIWDPLYQKTRETEARNKASKTPSAGTSTPDMPLLESPELPPEEPADAQPEPPIE